MLSYRHGFHAGNHADVLKHAVLVFVLDYLCRKDKPWWFVDTHAGAARYDLDSEWARKNAEHESGIARLWGRRDLPAALASYVDHVRRVNATDALKCYPGSPQFALQCARPDDRLRLFELHPTESDVLRAHLGHASRQIQIRAEDGFAGLAAVLPPPTRRGLVLIDPSYEELADYSRVPAAIKAALKRFSTGTYMVWYPQLQRRESQEFPTLLERMARAAQTDWLHTALTVRTPSPDGFGMHGSGLFVLNPPYTLPQMLASVLPCLKAALGLDSGAATTLSHHIA
jgi:23S rRNA (adenine2030-N6)-methyltransferase